MKKLSLRLRLMIFFVLISGIIWCSAGLVSWFECREKVDEFFDSYQLVLARQMATADWSHVNAKTQKITNKIIDNVHNAEEEDEAIGFAVFDTSGKMIFNDDENGKDFVFSAQTGVFVNQKIDHDDLWRFIRVPSSDGKFIITIGQELEYRDDLAFDLIEEFLLPWLGGLVFLLIFTLGMITLEFRPIKGLAKDLSERTPDDLSPIEGNRLPSEIKPFINALNNQFRQIEAMLVRERSFISDSAHELRSPLTALKIQLEVAQLSKNDETALDESFKKLSLGIDRSTRLIEQLLALSKIDSNFGKNTPKELIDWKTISSLILKEHLEQAQAKSISLKEDIFGEAPISEGNPVLCALLLRNLVDNAIKYSPDEADVLLRIGDKTLEVINTNTNLDEKIIPHLKERFYRPAGQKETGSGLGLAIVQRICEYHSCRLDFQNTSEGFCVRVEKLSD